MLALSLVETSWLFANHARPTSGSHDCEVDVRISP
jgi:hypothetical protein